MLQRGGTGSGVEDGKALQQESADRFFLHATLPLYSPTSFIF